MARFLSERVKLLNAAADGFYFVLFQETEKILMQQMLGLLCQKDALKVELADVESELSRERTPPHELIQRAPSFDCYSHVFLHSNGASSSSMVGVSRPRSPGIAV